MKPVDFPRFLLPLPLRTFRERRTNFRYCSTNIRFMQGKVRRLYAAVLQGQNAQSEHSPLSGQQDSILIWKPNLFNTPCETSQGAPLMRKKELMDHFSELNFTDIIVDPLQLHRSSVYPGY